MTYTELQTAVANYLHRTDLTSLLPSFIEYGRLRLFDRLRVPEMVTKSSLALTSSEGSLSIDCVAVREVLDDTDPLTQVSLAEARLYGSGVYAVQGLTLVAPGYSSVEVIWYQRPTTFLGASGSATRTLLDAYPQLWIQAAVTEAYNYIQDTVEEDKSRLRLDTEIASANARGSRTMFGAAPRVRSQANVFATGSNL